MDQLHKTLTERHTWYAAYHRIPAITFINFFVLIIVGLSFTATVQNALAQNVPGFSQVALSAQQQNLAQLTGQILRATKVYNASPEQTKEDAKQKLVSLIGQRKTLMLSVAVNNPHGFLLNALPSG